SNEYAGRNGGTDNNAFLQGLYRDVLHRPLDPAGAQTWGQVLTLGTSRVTVATAILGSSESATVRVRRLFGQFLHRPADPNGLSTFTTLSARGATDNQVAIFLLASDEYFLQL